LSGHQPPADSSADEQQREQKQQQLATRLAQLPRSNGNHHGDPTQQQPQIPQQPDDPAAVEAWQQRHDEIQQLRQKGKAGGWLISSEEVSRKRNHSTEWRAVRGLPSDLEIAV
jgi:hypothetical protein